MPSLLCCRAPRSSSPPLPNRRHVDTSNEKHRELRYHVPTHSVSTASSKSAEDLQAIHQIFASSTQDENGQGVLAPQGQIHGLDTKPGMNIHHKESSGRLQDVTTKLRKRLSRDSAVSRRSSKRKMRSTTSEEDMERRRELKRALHKRLQDEILEDRRVSQGGYDPDAETIATPSTSRVPTGGSVRISPRYLGEVLRRLESVRELEKRGRRRSEPGLKAINQTQDVFRRNQSIRSVAAPFRKTFVGGPGRIFTNQTQKDSEDDLHTLDTHQPTDTSLRIPEQSPTWRPCLRLDYPDTTRPTSDLYVLPPTALPPATPPRRSGTASSCRTIKAPPALDLPPLRLPSISGSVTARKWRLSLTPGRGKPFSGGDTDVLREKVPEDSKAKSPRARRLLIGTSSFLGPIRSNEIVRRSAEEQSADGDHASHCTPFTEEDDCGGIDDGLDSPRVLSQQEAGPASEDLVNPNRRATSTSVHLYDMRISQRLGSQGILPDMSSPHPQEKLGHQRGMSSRGSSLLFPVTTRQGRQTSSSGLTSLKVPRSWGGVSRDNTSSVYHSQGGSLTSSPNSSVIRFPNLSDTLWQSKSFHPHDDVPVLDISAPHVTSTSAIPWKSTNPSRPRRLTIDTASFYSSTDSFRAREVAAAETRIVPRSRSASVPKISRFKEDFEAKPSIDDSLQEGHSIHHKVKRRHSIASYDGSDECYPSDKRQSFGYDQLPTGMEASTALWERAFQQHAEGGVSSSKMRSGSILQEPGTGSVEAKAHDGKVRKTNPPLIPAGIGFKAEGWSFESKSERTVEIPEIDPKQVSRRDNLHTSSTTSRSSWSRYPSHTRAERSSSPAGEADNVIARDFAAAPHAIPPPASNPETKPKRGFSMLGKRKSRSMTFGKSVLKTLTRLYKSHSSDFRPSPSGHRSSVHIGGLLEYPELEVLAPLSPIFLPSSDDDHSAGPAFPPLPAHHSAATQQSVQSAERSAAHGRRPPPPDTRTWSRAYDDCVVVFPRDTDAASTTEASASVLLHPDSTAREQDARNWRKSRGHSAADVRASTLDFQRALQAHEALARERALRAAEEPAAGERGV